MEDGRRTETGRVDAFNWRREEGRYCLNSLDRSRGAWIWGEWHGHASVKRRWRRHAIWQSGTGCVSRGSVWIMRGGCGLSDFCTLFENENVWTGACPEHHLRSCNWRERGAERILGHSTTRMCRGAIPRTVDLVDPSPTEFLCGTLPGSWDGVRWTTSGTS